MRPVVMNDFRAEPEALQRAQLNACERVFRSGWWILGQEVAAFEREWAQWTNLEHVVGCGNGLDAIEIGLRALGIGPGDEVVTTPVTAFATVLAVIRAGATPVLADIDAGNAMLDPESVRRCMGPRTKAILTVHLYGQIGPVTELRDLASGSGVHLIEDCAQAHGARFAGKSAGSFGAYGAWSFYPTKNLGAVGDAGALTTHSDQLAGKARSMRNYGQSERYHHALLGMNSRLDELQAAILRERLPYLQQWIGRRREVAVRYSSEIRNAQVRMMSPPREAESHAYHLFVVNVAQRDEFQRHLKQSGVESLFHYPIPIHFQEPCRQIARDPRGLECAEAHARSCISLPCHPAMSEQDVDRVIAAVNSFGA